MLNIEVVKSGIIEWIKEVMYWSGGKTAVIGISGGKDSSVVAALCVEALGKSKVVGVLMPQGEQSDIRYSYDLVNHLDITSLNVNIGSTIDELSKSIGAELSQQAKVNLPARIRMSTLYAIAQTLHNGRVICTSNLSEDWVGFATLYGDSAGAFAPLGMLTSDEVVELGRELGLPEHLITKKPEDGLTGKSDEDNFGFTYAVLNKYIRTGVCEDLEIKSKIDKMHKFSRFKFLPVPMFNPEIEIKGNDLANIYK